MCFDYTFVVAQVSKYDSLISLISMSLKQQKKKFAEEAATLAGISNPW